MAAKKKKSKKRIRLKKRKLEERIAPGMIGGGIADTEMATSFEGGDDSPLENKEAKQINTNTNTADSGWGDEQPSTPGASTQYNQTVLTKTPDVDINTDGLATSPTDGMNHWGTTDDPGSPDYDGNFVYDQVGADGFLSVDWASLADQGDSFLSVEWANVTDDGSLNLDFTHQLADGTTLDSVINFNTEANTIILTNEFFDKDYYDSLHSGLTFNQDGSISAYLAEDVDYDYESNLFHTPDGQMDPGEFFSYTNLAADTNGALYANNPYLIAQTESDNMINLDNQAINQALPSGMSLSPEGDMAINLPDGTKYSEGGGCVIPPTNDPIAA